jgi:hypothetical protein
MAQRKTTSRSSSATTKKRSTAKPAARTTSNRSAARSKNTASVSEAAVVSASSSTVTTTDTSRRLRRMNLIWAGLYLAQAVAVALLSTSGRGVVPVVTNYLAIDRLATASNSGTAVRALATHRLFDLWLLYPLVLILLAGAVTHLLAATLMRRHYEDDLNRRTNCLRWVHYAVSGSLTLIVLGLLSGALDIVVLMALAALTVITAIFAHMLELRCGQGGVPAWVTTTIALAAALVPWLIIGLSVESSWLYGGGLPGFVYILDLTLLIVFILKAIALFKSGNGRGRWADFLWSEQVFMILGLAGSALLVWQVLAGALR